jgi:cytochrome c oxidase cbb3-type subunit 3
MGEPHRVDEIQGDIVHVYDDIEEADNRLPNWWLWTFYIAIAFAVVYWAYYHQLRLGKGPLARYNQERLEQLNSVGEITGEELVAMSQDPLVVPEGRRIFEKNCVTCHGSEAGGKIGPNLTDEYWLRGGAPMQILDTVMDGTDKGMQAWASKLGPGRVRQVVAYVLSVRNTNKPGKGHEGKKYVPAASTKKAAAPKPGKEPPEGG